MITINGEPYDLDTKVENEILFLRDIKQQQAEQIEQAKADNRLLSVGKEVEKTKAENIYEDWCELVDKHKQQAEQLTEWERKHEIRVDLLAQVYRCNGANLCDGCKAEIEIVLKHYKPGKAVNDGKTIH